MKIKNGILKKIFSIICLVFMIFVSINYYAIFLYLSNISEISVGDFWRTSISLCMVGIGIFGISWIAVRVIGNALFITVLFNIVFSNYVLIETVLKKLVPFFRFWHIIAFIIVGWGILCLLLRKKEKSIINDINIVLGIVLIGLVVINIVPNVGNIIEKCNNSEAQDDAQNEEFSPIYQNEETRNVYYLVFDEYSTNSFMEKYYNYDNSEFTDWLEEKGFKVSYSSHSDTYDTKIIMTNNVNLDYITTSATFGEEEQKARQNSKLFGIFRQNGYGVKYIGEDGLYGEVSVTRKENENIKGGVTNEGFSYKDLVLKNTPLYIWITSNNLDARVAELNEYMDYLLDPQNISLGKTLTMMHILLPHASFVFDSDGNAVNAIHLNEWEDGKYYKDQFIFTTKKMKRIVENIISNDKDAIILLTSDHSARNMSKIEDSDKSQCFVALYDTSIQADIEGESVVNLLRMIVNHLFDMNFELLERP